MAAMDKMDRGLDEIIAETVSHTLSKMLKLA